jgi:hypothetical protein
MCLDDQLLELYNSNKSIRLNRKRTPLTSAVDYSEMWYEKKVRAGQIVDGKRGVKNVKIKLEVSILDNKKENLLIVELDFANAESIYMKVNGTFTNTHLQGKLLDIPKVVLFPAGCLNTDPHQEISVTTQGESDSDFMNSILWNNFEIDEKLCLSILSHLENEFKIRIRPPRKTNTNKILVEYITGKNTFPISSLSKSVLFWLYYLNFIAYHKNSIICLDDAIQWNSNYIINTVEYSRTIAKLRNNCLWFSSQVGPGHRLPWLDKIELERMP